MILPTPYMGIIGPHKKPLLVHFLSIIAHIVVSNIYPTILKRINFTNKNVNSYIVSPLSTNLYYNI